MEQDFLDEMIEESTQRNPEFPSLMEEARLLSVTRRGKGALLIRTGGFWLIVWLLQLCQRHEEDDEDNDVEGGTPGTNCMQTYKLDVDQVEDSDHAHECQEELRDPHPALQSYRTPANSSQDSKGEAPDKSRDADGNGCARND